MKNKEKAFTLVELIVVITILAILWTIGFLSFQSYNVFARDTVRVYDLKNINSVLEYTYTESWRYPIPDEWVEISYSGWTVWTQWTFWKKSKRATKRLNKAPIDPLTQNEYTYSVLNTNSEFELWSIFEWDEVANNKLIEESYADEGGFKAYITWNYNWQIAKVNTGWIDYILALPSIVNSDITELDLSNIISDKKLSFRWYKNIPHSYWLKYNPIEQEEIDKIEFVKNDFIIYSWTWIAKKLEDSEELKLLTKNLQKAYSWTTISDNTSYQTLLNIDTDNLTQVNNQVWTLINDKLWAKIDIVPSSEVLIETLSYPIPTDWLVAEYLFEDNANDETWIYNWIVVWSPSYNNWKVWKSLKINSNWDWIKVTDFFYKTKDNLTFSLWIKRSSTDTEYASSPLNWIIWTLEKKIWFRGTDTDFIFTASDWNAHVYNSVWNTLSDNIWYFIVWINNWDEIKMYLDWILIWEENISLLSNVNSNNASWNRNFWIWYSGSDDYPYSFIWWELDQLRIYDKALTETEIRNLYYEWLTEEEILGEN